MFGGSRMRNERWVGQSKQGEDNRYSLEALQSIYPIDM
jgi:hypothetical protein